MKIGRVKGLRWIGDVAQVLLLDRFDPKRKRVSEAASTACRSLGFHAHCKIAPLSLSTVVEGLTPHPVESVALPAASSNRVDVGNHAYYHALATLVRAANPKSILEIGTFLGVGTLTMALNVSAECQIFTVDLPDAVSEEAISTLNDIDRGHVATSRRRVGEAFLFSPLCGRITQIRADSMTWRADEMPKNVDFVLIDGGHSLPVITKDTDNAFRVLSANGVILWDDYFHLYPDVVHFLDGLSNSHRLYGIEDTNLVVYSPRFDGIGRAMGNSR